MDPSERTPAAASDDRTGDGALTAMPHLTAEESVVLDALSTQGGHLTAGSLRACTGLTPDELRSALDGLRAKGLVARLNTVVESYAPRFPGLRVESD